MMKMWWMSQFWKNCMISMIGWLKYQAYLFSWIPMELQINLATSFK